MRHSRARPPGLVRIIGGQWKRTPLPVVATPGLRPTPDRIRKTLFDWLAHLYGRTLEGRNAVDLYAGTGALGFEAASRGASNVLLVERDRAAADALRAIKDKLGATHVRVEEGTAGGAVRRLIERGERFDLVFLDPPFGTGALHAMLPSAVTICGRDGCIYAESEARMTADEASHLGLMMHRSDRAGDVFYHLLQPCNNNDLSGDSHAGRHLSGHV